MHFCRLSDNKCPLLTHLGGGGCQKGTFVPLFPLYKSSPFPLYESSPYCGISSLAFKHRGKIPYPTSLPKDVCSLTSSDCHLVFAHSQMLPQNLEFGLDRLIFSVETCFFIQGICIPRCNNFDVNQRHVLPFVSELCPTKCGFMHFLAKSAVLHVFDQRSVFS